MNRDICSNDVLMAILRLQPGTAPGQDRYTSDFYKMCAASLAPILARLYHFFSTMGTLSDIMKLATIKVPLTHILQDEASKMDRDICSNEVLMALLCLQLGTAPGQDRDTSDFYKMCAASLAPILACLYHFFSTMGTLSHIMKLATIKVLPKPGKDTTLHSSNCPICLLNIDTKIWTSFLASYLTQYMQFLVYPDLVYTLQLGEDAVTVLNASFIFSDKTKYSQIPSLLLSINEEKAFNYVHWQLLWLVLTKIGLGVWFSRWTWCSYTGPRAMVRVNGLI
ncbi:hypothetical protein NDU88_004517 [Pleurodeles waltl]|uniref:Uncharacterized protein n=1 Tax=Pleurodeles waltl TaxID=8319 RepID=A0AAV7LIU2_PLEWA|nr:hypothetical protein NDU88_004517 [Pleurodeles waltl]